MVTKTSKQLSKSATIILNGNIHEVFPLFSPKGEEKWVRNWQPEYIFPENGEFIENMVFTTPSNNEKENQYNWILSYLNKILFKAIYTVSTPNRIWSVKVQCTAIEALKTIAVITYNYTALNSLGEKLNREAIINMYSESLKDWETAINYYINSGGKIKV